MFHLSEFENDEWVHVDNIPDHDFGKELMKDLLSTIYNNGSLEDIHSALDDLTGYFDISMPKDLPPLHNLQVKKNEK